MKKVKNKKSCGCGAEQVNLKEVAKLTKEITDAGLKAGEIALEMMAENKALRFVLTAIIDDKIPERYQEKFQVSIDELVKTCKEMYCNNQKKKGDSKVVTKLFKLAELRRIDFFS